MKIGIKKEKTAWFFDDMNMDFEKYTRHQITRNIKEADLIWANKCIFPQCYNEIKNSSFKGKIFVHLHHIVEKKMNEYDFELYNKADGCVVPNEISQMVASKYLDIPVYKMPYWVISKRMTKVDINEIEVKTKELSPNGEILIGSFQKDSEGDSARPKLEKGPDIFLDIVEKLNKEMDIKVILAGPSRKYLTKNLKNKNIPYEYFNRPYKKDEKDRDINLLYDCLDWYLITSRVEGGPQSVLESAYRKIKVLSSNMGIAPEILHPDCICNEVNDFVEKVKNNLDRRSENYNTIQSYIPEVLIPKWDDFWENIVK